MQPRPQGFSLKKWSRPHPFFEGKALGTRLHLMGRKDKLQEEEEAEIDRKKRQKTKQKLSSISHRSPLPEASVT